MQAAVIISNVILAAISFLCIYMKMYKCRKGLWEIVKRTIFLGGAIGAFVSVLVIGANTAKDILTGFLLGCFTGEIIYIFYLIAKSVWEKETVISYYDDGTPAKYYITGDKHRDFSYVKGFCRDLDTRRKDVLIILGDAGFNYFGDGRDDMLKKEVSAYNITLFCVHGNKENRPQNIGTYGIRSFCGGKVYYEPKYPNILFAIDGEIYTFEDKKYMVVGGAHSVDKVRCLEEGRPFWEDEMPDDLVKAKVEERLKNENNTVYGMITHTCPIAYLPTEMFISTRQNVDSNVLVKKKKERKRKPQKEKKVFKPDIDRSTEEWLGEIEKELNYKIWFCGHYHVDKQIDKVNMMYHEIRPLHWK